MKKSLLLIILIISLVFTSTICVNANDRNLYPIEPPDINKQQGDISCEIYFQSMLETGSNTLVNVTYPDFSNIDLVLQIVVVYTDYDYDLNFRYGHTIPDETFAAVYGSVTYNTTKVVDNIQYECHVYVNNVYIDTITFAYFY